MGGSKIETGCQRNQYQQPAHDMSRFTDVVGKNNDIGKFLFQ
jgi:hypothetical protein